MFLKHLSLTNFRNYPRLELDLPARIHVLQGENAQGKTNLLEAIYYLSTTKSPLTSVDRQLINWQAEQDVIPFARVEGVFERAGAEHSIEMTLVKERQPGNGGEVERMRRQIRLDGVPRRAMDVVGALNVVLFLPEDISLVAGPPSERRRYLDITLCQIDPVYCRSLSRYGRVTTQRNALLRQIKEGRARVSELDYWDEKLAQLGALVLARRLEAVRELGRYVDELHPALTGGKEQLSLLYESTVAEYLAQAAGRKRQAAAPPLLEDSEAAMARWEADFRRALKAARREEVARTLTVVGPHRDDVRFLIQGMDATVYGSRGQQRTVALSLKLAEVKMMCQRTGQAPILLLDDVLSELDRRRSEFLLNTIANAEQVLITTTDLFCYSPEFLSQVCLWQVVNGTVRPIDAPAVSS
jgi:DNA replication and repair protein RecF